MIAPQPKIAILGIGAIMVNIPSHYKQIKTYLQILYLIGYLSASKNIR